MRNFYGFSRLILIAAVVFSTYTIQAQSTWDRVHTILQTNCGGSGCHGNNGFDVNDPKADLYAALINGVPNNPYAQSKEYKYVIPGQPYQSFLLRKIAHGLGTHMSADLELNVAEGTVMPQGRPALSKVDIETIRQWILAGADATTAYATADTVRLSKYYNLGGLPMVQAPAPPAEGEGFQVHLGPIFFDPGEENEYFLKHELFLQEEVEITGLYMDMNDESHHFILRKFKPGTKQNWEPGIELLNPITAFDADKDYVMAWQNNEDFDLPDGTAYFWDTTSALDLNFHMQNYNTGPNDILPGEVYLNVLTQPAGTAEKEMKSELVNNLAFYILPNGQPQKFTASQNKTNASIWTLASHTHSRGTDFKIYLKDQNDNRADTLYNGKVNYETGVNTGYYDWEHPPTRFWHDLNTQLCDTLPGGGWKYKGFEYEAEYVNNTGSPLTFGFTTNEEMMIFYVQYVEGFYKVDADTTGPVDTTDTTGIVNIPILENTVSVYPNPFTDNTVLSFTLQEKANVTLEVYNLMGQRVALLEQNVSLEPNQYTYPISAEQSNIRENGLYFLRITAGNKVVTKKLMLNE